MSKLYNYNTLWNKMFDFFRILISFLVYSILIVSYLILLIKFEEKLEQFQTSLLSSILTFLLILFIPSVVIVLLNSYILGPLSNLLFTYFYVRIDLKTGISFRDTFKLSKVFHPFSQELIWFPLKEFKSLPNSEKRDYLLYYTEKRNKEGALIHKPKDDELQFPEEYLNHKDSDKDE